MDVGVKVELTPAGAPDRNGRVEQRLVFGYARGYAVVWALETRCCSLIVLPHVGEGEGDEKEGLHSFSGKTGLRD